MCDKCLESPEYDLDYDGGDFLCPKCGYKMVYWETCEIDTETIRISILRLTLCFLLSYQIDTRQI